MNTMSERRPIRLADHNESEEDWGLVEPQNACPQCGERKQDNLVWDQEEANTVTCATCGTIYMS